MVETESILNSIPLTNVAEQPDNEEPLTPNHFLIQRPFNRLPPGRLGDQQPAILKTWKNTQKLMNHIWRRLVKEYLPTLSRRSKWSNSNDRPLKVDDIVWVLKGQTPRGIWPLGRFMETTTRWRYNSRKGKNGLRHVRSTRFQSRTCFFSVVFFIFFAPVLGNVSYPLPTNWCTDDIDNISAYSFRANFKEDDKRLQSIDASENPWCPLCALAACRQCYRNFQEDSNKPPKLQQKLWLFCPTTWNLDVLF